MAYLFEGKYRRLPWYWIVYFRVLGKVSKWVGIPNDLRLAEEYNPIARWFFFHVSQPSLYKLLALKEKGYY